MWTPWTLVVAYCSRNIVATSLLCPFNSLSVHVWCRVEGQGEAGWSLSTIISLFLFLYCQLCPCMILLGVQVVIIAASLFLCV